MNKAIREAKVSTSWTNPDLDYEAGVDEFIEHALGDRPRNRFLASFEQFQQSLLRAGLCNSLSQTLLKLTSPGMPDIYQGNELWDFSLVDPDNRRAVDYALRERLLAELEECFSEQPRAEVAANLVNSLTDSGRAKLYLTWRTLMLRRYLQPVFRKGDYLPMATGGSHATHLCAFVRQAEHQLVMCVVPRLIYRLAEGEDPIAQSVWQDTWIESPLEHWKNWLTGEVVTAKTCRQGGWRVSAAQVLNVFPVALLCGETDSGPDSGADPDPDNG